MPRTRRKHPRRSDEGERAYGPVAFRNFLYNRPCCIKGCEVATRRPGFSKVQEMAHVVTGGTGRKADWDHLWPDGRRGSIIDPCWKHHDEMHDQGVETFEETYAGRIAPGGVVVETLVEGAKVVYEQFDEYENGLVDAAEREAEAKADANPGRRGFGDHAREVEQEDSDDEKPAATRGFPRGFRGFGRPR